MSVFRESSLSDRKRILSDVLFGSFLPQSCLSCSQWFSLSHTISYLPCLSSAQVFPIGRANVSYFLDDGYLSEQYWWKTFTLSSHTPLCTHLCCQSLTAPSFLDWSQYNFLPLITVIVRSDSERGIFPSAAVTFQCSWCLVIACLHSALFFTEYTKPVYKGTVWAAIFSRKSTYLHTALLLSFK